MTSGIPGTGLYSRMRTLQDALRADRSHLKNAPLGPIQKTRLARQIAEQEEELRQVRREIRETKKEK